MQSRPTAAAIRPGGRPRLYRQARPARGQESDIEPGEEPGGMQVGREPRQDKQAFDFRQWFFDQQFQQGHPGIAGDYLKAAELLGISSDYVERLVNRRRTPSRQIVTACRRIDATAA